MRAKACIAYPFVGPFEQLRSHLGGRLRLYIQSCMERKRTYIRLEETVPGPPAHKDIQSDWAVYI